MAKKSARSPWSSRITPANTTDTASLVDLNRSIQTGKAKLATIKLKKIQQLNTADSPLLIQKHKQLLNWMMRTFGLDSYGLSWVQFFKGLGLGGVLVWLVVR